MKKVIRVICFLVLLSLCTAAVYKPLSMKDTKGEVGSSVKQLDYTEDNIIDVAFVGSSHVFAGNLPSTLWKDFGIVSFDMSVSSMDMDSVYYYTKNMLKTQSPKYVFVELYSFTFDEHAVVENTHRNMLGLPYSMNNYKLVNAYFGDSEEKHDIRIDYQLRWPIIHTRYKELSVNDFVDLGTAKYGRGEKYVLGSGGEIDLTESYTEEVAELDEKRIKWLENMKSLAEEENFKLIFYATPCTYSHEEQMYINAAGKYARENGITFFDFGKMVEEMSIDLKFDSSDANHLNVTGAQKLSKYIGYYLLYDEEIETHKDEEGYEYWDLDAAYLDHIRSGNYLFELYSEGAVEAFFETLNAIPGISYIVSLDGEWWESSHPMEDYLYILGADISEIGEGGVWVKVSGHDIEHVADNDDKEIHYIDLDRINTARIARSEADAFTEIKIGNIIGQQTNKGINIVVYDNVKYEFLGKWYLY